MTTTERETKLAPSTGFRLPPLTDPGGGVFASPETTATLVATYYDTTDLRIIRAGASLRYRDPEGWTVKLPRADGDEAVLSRDEHRLGGEHRSVPESALDLVRSRTRGLPIAPVATLSTIRTTVALHDAQGQPIGEVVDDAVTATFPESDAGPVQFGEVELELTEAARDGHRAAILARLRSSGAATVDLTPKIVRALGVPATRSADIVVPELGDGFPTIEAVVQRAIASSVDRLVTYDPAARLGDDPEGVHQARVATRRLRSDLRTFRSLLDEQWRARLSDELRWLGDVFGVVRDADVLLDRLEPKIRLIPDVDREPAKRILDHLRSDQERGRDQMLRALRSERYDALLDRLLVASARPRFLLRVDDTDDAEILREIVRKPWTKLAAGVDRLGDDPPDLELHGIRIRAKRARYAAEAVVPAFGKPARIYARAVTALQDVLGEHQDAVVAAEWLRRAAAQTDDESTGFAAGLLAAIEYRAAEQSRGSWADAWRRASRKKLRALAVSPETEPDIRAAGGILVRRRRHAGRRRTELALVHRPRYDDWTFPKGKRDADDEDDEATALREVEEETGFACDLGEELGSTWYRDAKGRNKLVRYWRMTLPEGATGEEFLPNREVDELRWCTAAEAGRILTYEHDRVLLAQVRGRRP